jgi:hypothetical protein
MKPGGAREEAHYSYLAVRSFHASEVAHSPRLGCRRGTLSPSRLERGAFSMWSELFLGCPAWWPLECFRSRKGRSGTRIYCVLPYTTIARHIPQYLIAETACLMKDKIEMHSNEIGLHRSTRTISRDGSNRFGGEASPPAAQIASSRCTQKHAKLAGD